MSKKEGLAIIEGMNSLANPSFQDTQEKYPHMLNICLGPHMLNMRLTYVEHMLEYTYVKHVFYLCVKHMLRTYYKRHT